MATSTTPEQSLGVGSKSPNSLDSSLTRVAEDVRRIPVVEEELQVDKQTVDRGGVRVTKRVETREEFVDELLRGEHVEVERRPVNTAIAGDVPPGIRYEGDTLVVPIVEEVLITVKRLVLVEEVRITRTETSHRKPQTFTLRKETIEIERLAVEETSSANCS